MSSKFVIFDLDDTLYKEISYLKSAFYSIAYSLFSIKDAPHVYNQMLSWYFNKENVFANLIENYSLSTEVTKLIESYRNHYPNIQLDKETSHLLSELKSNKVKTGLITDGFSITQRNKLKALGLDSYFDSIVISEEFGTSKPHINNFAHFLQFGATDYFYIADNIKKDFITPNELGWCSICLQDNGENIHKQDFDIETKYLPKYVLTSMNDLLPLIFD
ncbi:HAD family hydrolase [Emticicia sp. 21SJ11W-3]|uniref:HAD family hydrolase n=1 Tax=Emticicia sp. 21SJ11W-3 TaxID=2916755 RepID=UPI00209F845B|nr:HAD family hydrolase [Emticicia sp. 21SJ11W-3]UTA68414.1 HAD family hydrolase [Emticicia sp. 21SJ11W-3]